MIEYLSQKLSHRNGVVRKAAIAALRVPRWMAAVRARDEDFSVRPPVLVNSFPKSGTHLVNQIVEGLPDRTNYGAFLASMTSSFQFRERSTASARRFIRGFAPGEIVRGHLFFDPQCAEELTARRTVHYFVYRDLRDVVISEAHYLREMNRWHRLHCYFRPLGLDAAIMLAITGFSPRKPKIDYPNIGARFGRYASWINRDDCLGIRFEDLISDQRPAIVRDMAVFYAQQTGGSCDIDSCVAAMMAHVAPHKSHTFRSGKKSGWQTEFAPEHRRAFDEVAGDLLIRLGYEANHDWATAAVATG